MKLFSSLASHAFTRTLVCGVGCLLAGAANSGAQTVAFPGALGFGAAATGAATADANGKHVGGNVYHVTNLNDSGSGSFRDAVSASGRVIVFDVGGYINLASAISAKSNLTIAGQTAPGGGIGITGAELSFANQSNIICRFVRIRPGGASASSDDCLSLYRANTIIMDHCSLDFAKWNNIDAVGDSTRAATNFTVQNSIIANPIGQQFGAHTEMVGGFFSWFNNIFANGHNRQPLAKDNTIFVNNVLYNYQSGYTTHTSTPFKHDIVNNYFICGPASGSGGNTWFQIDTNQSMYYTGNLVDNNKNSVLDGVATAPYPGYHGTGTVLASPWSPITTALLPGVLATANAVPYNASTAGCLPHDEIESLIVSQLKTLGNGPTGTGVGTAGPGGGLYTSQTQTGLSNNGFGTIAGGTSPIDSDQDGMPDDWENAKGLNAANAADGKLTAASGYTNLEDYLNWLALPHAFVGKNGAVDIDLSLYAAGFPSTATYTVSGVTGGAATQSGQGGSQVHFVPTAGTGPVVAGFTFAVSNGSYTMTRAVGVLVSANAAAQNLRWYGGTAGNAWDGSTQNWVNQSANTMSAFGGGDRVTFDDSGSHSPAVNITGVLAPSSVEVRTDTQDYTFSGYGWLSGATALVKDGAGTLTIAPTVLIVNSTMTAGSAAVTVPSTANMSVGMVLTASSGVPSGTVLAAINSATSVTFSKAATISQTANVNYFPFNSYTGPTTFNAGTIVLGSGGTLGTGTLNLYGTLTNSAPSGNTVSLSNSIVVAAGSAGTINMGSRFALGGSVTGGGTLNLNVQTTISRDDLAGSFANFAGTLNFLGGGGVRLLFNGGIFDGLGAATVNLGSGISLYPQTNSGGNTVNIGELNGAGSLYGGNVSTATYAVGGLNTSTTYAGQILDLGTNKAAFTKTGTGTLTLTGTGSNFSGPLTVSAGTLATLGTFGGLVTVSGGTLSLGTPGASPGTLAANGGLTLAGATVAYDLSNSPSGTNDSITAPTGTTVTLSGTDAFQINMVNGALGSGTYTLIGGAATLGVSGLTLSLTTTPPLPSGSRQTLALARQASGSSPAYVRLVVTGDIAALTWTGANSGIWDLSTTQSWSSTAANNPNLFYNFDAVTFDDSTANGTVTLSGTVQPNTLNVTGSTTNYNFTGAGAIGGSAKLVKSGTDTLTISNSVANTFTGGTVLNAGVIAISNANSALGTGPIAMNGGTLSLQGVTLPNAMVFTGTSAINSSGNAQIVGSTANTMTSVGSAVLNLGGVAGVFSINGDMSGFTGKIALGASSALVRLNANSSGANDVNSGSANTVFDLGSAGAGLCNRNGNVTLNLGAVQSTGANTGLYARQTGSSGYTNTTAVTFTGGGGTGAAATATASGGILTGVTITNGGTGYTTAPTVTFAGGGGSGATGTATVSSGAVTSVTLTNGGTGVLTESDYVIGGLGTDATFAGKIVNNPGVTGGGDFLGLNITKVGAGNWTLSGTSNFVGDVFIQEGTLTISGSLTNDGDFEVGEGMKLVMAGGTLTTPTLMVDGSATLSGYGTINADVVNQGSVTVSTGTLTINGAVENDGVMRVTNGATLVANGAFVNNGVLDYITGNVNVVPPFTNNGTVLDSTSVTVQDVSKTGTTFKVSVQSYTGHNFTLQRTNTLSPANWQTVQTQAGTGAVLQFSDTGVTGGQGFYRFQVSP